MAHDALITHARDKLGIPDISTARPVQVGLALVRIPEWTFIVRRSSLRESILRAPLATVRGVQRA